MLGTTEATSHACTCDVPQCGTTQRIEWRGGASLDRAADHFIEQGWAFVGLDANSGWSILDFKEGVYLQLCPDHAKYADVVGLMVALIDHKDEMVNHRRSAQDAHHAAGQTEHPALDL